MSNSNNIVRLQTEDVKYLFFSLCVIDSQQGVLWKIIFFCFAKDIKQNLDFYS